MAALTPDAPKGAFKSIFGRLFGFFDQSDSSTGFNSLWLGGPAGKVVASTRNDMFTVFTGKNGAGACTLTGARVGDLVLGVFRVDSTPADASANFETAITVADQIQQSSASDLHLEIFAVLVKRQS